MKFKDLCERFREMGIEDDTEVVLQTTQGTFSDFLIERCDHEYADGSVVSGPDEQDPNPPRPLPYPILALDCGLTVARTPVTV